ncbi:NAD(P)H-dependent oxidoreductase [Leucobacter viscericola]|uniref:NAD(P)H-dependent oxidoreductase n=1 Tax=Leucobacter viscericola TaxID=2714935 RepID=A0A6G7XFS1_9MICO|nr:NAD(P)H-dependent oxidoreductase [Leucobacter viscericola]QIK63316.1 NAD(P)H-dependent oxidoreductase [Leucobacter viscericola]
MPDNPTRVLILNTTLKASPERSSTEALATELGREFPAQQCEVTTVRVVDLNLPPGISVDLGEGDDWPGLRQQILDSDIVVFATPTWLGHMTSVMRRVLERLNADIATLDADGRPIFAGLVAAALVVGNEDGAHKIVADLLQGANDLAFSVPANGCTYWNGRAMEKIDFQDLETTPKAVRDANKALASNALHLSRLLREHPYPVS